MMETTTGIETAPLRNTTSELGQLATWNRARTLDQLRAFVSAHDDALNVEDFDF